MRMQKELARQLPRLSQEVHRYVPDFHIGRVSEWQTMAGLPPAYRPRLLAIASSISVFTTTFIRGLCILHALVKRMAGYRANVSRTAGRGHSFKRTACTRTSINVLPRLKLGQENELGVDRSTQFGHNEDMEGSCTEIKPSPPSNPCGIHL